MRKDEGSEHGVAIMFACFAILAFGLTLVVALT